MEPIVSIIMPVYNNIQWIGGSINSILNQTYKNFELIIINDGSTDGTSSFLGKIKDSRLILHNEKKNKGIVSALNKGLSLAQGKYIARMDGDDFSDSRRLERQIEFLENNSEYILVATEVETFSHEKKIQKSHLEELQNWYNEGHSNEEIRKKLWIGNCLNHPSVMFRSSILSSIGGGYNHKYQLAEDYELFFRMSYKGKMFKLQDKLLHYRVHSKQLSTKFSLKQREVDARIKAKQLKLLIAGSSSISKILIWGVGNGGQLIFNELEKNNIRIHGFIDINSIRWGGKFNDIIIYSPFDAISENFDLIIIATTLGRDYAEEFLNKKGFIYLQDFISVW